MQKHQKDAIESILEDATIIYNDGDRIEVEVTEDLSAARRDATMVSVAANVEEVIGRSLSGPERMMVLADTLSHEVEHVRESDLYGKSRIQDEYPITPRFAGTVANVLEDVYIDHKRLQRYPGLRKAHTFKVNRVMENSHRRPPLDGSQVEEKPVMLQEGFVQLALAGYVKGIDAAPEDVQEALADTREYIERVKVTDDPQDREDLFRTVIEILRRPIEDDIEKMREMEEAMEDMDIPEGLKAGEDCDADESEDPAAGDADGEGDGEGDPDAGPKHKSRELGTLLQGYSPDEVWVVAESK